jgi:hypothetical protein
MEGFKKKKTAENQLFELFFYNLFCDFETKQKSTLFEQSLNKERVFLKQLARG